MQEISLNHPNMMKLIHKKIMATEKLYHQKIGNSILVENLCDKDRSNIRFISKYLGPEFGCDISRCTVTSHTIGFH